MEAVSRAGRTAFTTLLCLSLALWSLMPSVDHAPKLLDILEEHLEMIEDHGHSHGLLDDLAWALHGHSHDAADHDHSQAWLTIGPAPSSAPERGDVRVLGPPSDGPSRSFPFERPPRL